MLFLNILLIFSNNIFMVIFLLAYTFNFNFSGQKKHNIRESDDS